MMYVYMVQLMLLPPIVSCFIKIQIGLAFLVLAYPDYPGKEAIKWGLCLVDWRRHCHAQLISDGRLAVYIVKVMLCPGFFLFVAFLKLLKRYFVLQTHKAGFQKCLYKNAMRKRICISV